MALSAISRVLSARGRLLSMLLVSAGLAVTACSGGEVTEEESGADGESTEAEDAVSGEAAISEADAARRDAICNSIRPGRAWSAEESERLLDLVVKNFADTKRENDRLIRERGIGKYAGFRTAFGKKLAAGDRAGAAALIKDKVKGGQSATQIVANMTGRGNTTSCVAWALKSMGEAYAQLGRSDEWKPVLDCAIAWDSIGTRFQAALVKSGWPAPGMAIVADQAVDPKWEQRAVERQAEIDAIQDPELKAKEVNEPRNTINVHKGLIGAIPKGIYYGAPLSKSVVLKNFLPWVGSATPRDESVFLQLGKSRAMGLGTLRAAYHVPIIVPAASVPSDFVVTNAHKAAQRRGEPFVMESHSLRQPWDPTNFEVRPLNEVIGETYSANVVYSTGTVLFPPFAQGIPQL